jgi:hypothetical protein
LLDLVEEPLDQVASPVEIRAEADRVIAIASRWDVCPNALLGSKGSDPVRVIAAVGEEHCSRLQAREEPACKPIVVSFPGRERQPERQAVAVDHRMNLAGESASRSPHGLPLVSGNAGAVLMHTHDGRVDHLDGGIMASGERVHDPAPDPGASPAHKAVVARGVGTEGDR